MSEGTSSEDLEIFRQAVRTFMRREIEPHVVEWDRAREVPRDVWRKIGAQGFLCPWVSEEFGGSGAGFPHSVIVAEEFARTRANAPMISLHGDIIVPYIASYGTEDQKRRWLPGCVSGDVVTAIAMTEPGTGSDLQGIATRARRDGGDWVIDGSKTFISNGIAADLVIVVCRTGGGKGMSLILVEAGTPGFTRGRKLDKIGNHGQDTAELFFDGCRVPAANLLGEEDRAMRLLMAKLPQERIVACVWSQVAAEVMLADTIEYVKTRKAFGKRIGDFQHVSFGIAEMATEVELGRTFLDALVRDHSAGRDTAVRAAMGKSWICEMANSVAYRCLQLHGGYGCMEEYPIARMYRDVRCHTIWAGTTEIMKSIVARSLGF